MELTWPTSYPGYFRYGREMTLVGAADDLLTWPKPKKNRMGGEGLLCAFVITTADETKLTSV